MRRAYFAEESRTSHTESQGTRRSQSSLPLVTFQAMLGRLSLFASRYTGAGFKNAEIGPSKAHRSQKIIGIKPNLSIRSISSLLKSTSATSSTSIKTMPRKSVMVQKRMHAGCGMPHGGDEVPGVGIERELRAHLNVTELVVEDTSGMSFSALWSHCAMFCPCNCCLYLALPHSLVS